MDTSIASRIDYVIHGHTVSRGSLSSAEWITIINAVLDQHRQHARKYLPYVRNYRNLVENSVESGGGGSYISCAKPPEQIVYSTEDDELNEHTRLLPLGQFGVRSLDADPPQHVWDSRELEETYLFLTDKFRWVLLRRWVTRIPHVSNKEFLFELIDEDKLIELIGSRTHWWIRIIEALRRAATKVIDEKGEHLKSLHLSLSGIDQIMGRLRP